MKKIKKNLKWITIGFVMIIIIGIFSVKVYLYNRKDDSKETSELKEVDDLILEEEEIEETQEVVYVDIKGAVVKPGVYEVSTDKKVIDVVNLAGGLTDQADTSMVNLAKKVVEEMVVIIYTKEEVKNATKEETVVKIIDNECVCPEVKNDACLNQNNTSSDKNSSDTNDEVVGKVNINTATKEELLNLSGIGESRALAIIEYREEHGGFKTVDEIMNVSGIGESLFEKIKDNITI